MEQVPRNDAFYRTSDSIEKLRIKLTIREVSRTVTLQNADVKRSDPYNKELTLKWQEKLHGPGDIADFIKHRAYQTKPRAGVDQDHYRHLTALEQDGARIEDMLQEVMLYTYTDREHYSPEVPPPAAISSGLEPYLGAAISGSGGLMDSEANDSERQRKIKARVYKEKPYKDMHVCLATDVDVRTLKEDKPWMPSKFFSEHRLLSIRLYNDGLVEMAPELSRIKDEGDLHHDSTGTAPSVFLSNKTVAAGLRSGMKLATYRVRSAGGSEFEYSIENAAEFSLPGQIEAARQADIVKDAYASAGTRSEGSWRMDPPVDGTDESIAYYCEIVSGSGFEGETLFVSYQISYPHDYRVRTGDLVNGVSEDVLKKMAQGQGVGGAAVSRKDQAMAAMVIENDGFEDGPEALGMLQGTTQTTKARAYRSSTQVPTLRPRWKGKHLSFHFDEFSRVVWGCSFFVLTVIAIVLGVEYPFWLIPCLIFTFGLGTGYPGGPQQVVLRSKLGCQSRKESLVAGKVLVGAAVAYPRAVFNHLVNVSFDRKSETLDDLKSREAPSSSAPTMVFQVYSVGLFGRVSLEGYGYQHLPANAGSIDVEIKTWRPLGDIRNQMADFFLGSSVRLSDPSFVHMSAEFKGSMASAHLSGGMRSAVVLNRFGVRSETSGEIRFRCHAVTCCPSSAVVQESLSKTAPKTRTVDDILKTYNNASSSNLRGTFNASLSSTAGLGASFASIGGLNGISREGGLSLAAIASNRASREDSQALGRRAEQLLAQAKERARVSSSLAPVVTGSKDVPLVSRSLEASPFVTAVADSKATGEAKEVAKPALAPLNIARTKGRYSDAEDEK